MKIEKLNLSGIGGIKELEINFHNGFNVICGPNGIGKTTILKTIVHAFSSFNTSLRKNALYEKGAYKIYYTDLQNKKIEKYCGITLFEPQIQESRSNVNDITPYIVYFKENRSINYENLNSIPRDISINQHQIGNALDNGVYIQNLKGWFDNRYVFSNMTGSLTDIQIANIELAKSAFSILDPTVSFQTVDASTLDIMLSSRNGTIYFEYLSAGYKSCIYLILGLLKEIEYRFGNQSVKAEDFSGVVLIDEIDLHLHPKWQASLIDALKKIFPKVQFIVTTHSPSVLQTLKREEIIPLTEMTDGNIGIKELNLTEYGLQGWSIEEILRDVMGMPETTSQLYENTKNSFDKAVNAGNATDAKEYYNILKKMLHPDSVVKRLIEIQIAGLE